MLASRRLRLKKEHVQYAERKKATAPTPGGSGQGRPLTDAELEAMGW